MTNGIGQEGLPYIELHCRLLSQFQLKTPAEILQANNSKTIQCRAMNLTSLVFCESIFVHLKPIKLV